MVSLLIGNGVNYLGVNYLGVNCLGDNCLGDNCLGDNCLGDNCLGDNVVGWSDLLKSLIKEIGKLDEINVEEKPFLHLYEEIFTKAEIREEYIKEKIVLEIKKMKPNLYHKEITDLSFENILTLNYDYNFTNNNSNVKNTEKKYSLRRYQQINNKKIWHIHGELGCQDSIMLGYSHYIDSINNIQTYLNKKDNNDGSTWVDIFLTNDIYILGAGLDFEELDIWWLLSYRNRKMIEKISLEGKNNINNPVDDNKIMYIDIDSEEYDGSKIPQESSNLDELLSKNEKSVNAVIKKKKNKAKLSMLKTFGVEIITFPLDNSDKQYQNACDAYADVIKYFREELG